MVKRVSKQQIVKPAPVVISTKSADAIFTKDNSDIVFTNESGVITANASVGAFNLIGSSGSAVASAVPSTKPVVPEIPVIPPPDVPSLADIESITFEEYADTTGVSKYKAIIKIRNSSVDKINVAGVDARIANPNGLTQYTLGTATASSASSASSFISNTTWYKAQSVYNTSTRTVYSAAAVIGNDQYLSDGSNVPKDIDTGTSSSIRVITVWRKTEAEAIAAATPNI